LELTLTKHKCMDIKYYIDKGFKHFCELEPSDKYTQGIGLKEVRHIKDNREHYSQPGVYVFANKQGEVLKIGQTSNMFNRMYTQYKCVTNATNNRIREHIKSIEDIDVYILITPKIEKQILGHTVYTSYAMGLEHALLKEFKQTTKRLPKLNTMIR